MSDREVIDWIDGYLEMTENSEPPKTFRLWSAISAISSVLQRKCYLEWGSITFYPNMYVILVGPPATRKGTAIKPMQDMLEEIGVKMAAEAITREALIKTLKDANEQLIDEKTDTPIFHSSLTIIAPELTSFLGFNNIQFLSDLSDWFDCRERWTYRTKLSGVDIIIGLYVSLFGATTPELIKAALPMEVIGSGLSSRIIFVYEETKGKIVPMPFYSKKALELKDKLFTDLQRIHLLRGGFTVSTKFIDAWVKWYEWQANHPPIQDPKFAGYCERRGLHAMKLCMILSASRSSKMIISDEDLRRAIEILKLTEKKMSGTFRGVGQDPYASVVDKVMITIMQAGGRGILFSQLQSIHLSDVDSWRLEKILETLKNMDWLVYEYDNDRKERIYIAKSKYKKK